MAKRHALLIGVSAYQKYAPLRTPTANARMLGALFQRNAQDWHRVDILQDVTYEGLRVALYELFKDGERDDLLLFYFSGHGDNQTPDGTLVLCSIDSDPKNYFPWSFRVTDLKHLIEGCRTERVVLIFDCCHSEGATRAVAMGPQTLHGALAEGKGKYIITSCRGWQSSFELPDEPHSIFTKNLLGGIEEFRGDTNNDGVLTLREVFDYANQRTIADADAAKVPLGQEPTYRGYESNGAEITLCTRPGASSGKKNIVSIPAEKVAEIRQHLRHPTIPVLGPSIHGCGTMSEHSLARELLKVASDGKAGIEDGEQYIRGDNALTESTEIFEEIQDRIPLLGALQTILRQVADTDRQLELYRLLMRMRNAQLIISFTLDLGLEQALLAAGDSFTIVTHVVGHADEARSGEVRGKILFGTVGPDVVPTVMLAGPRGDDLRLVPSRKRRVIYKPMGSPILADLLGEEAEPYDTSVITESNLIEFYHMLKTSPIPEAFSIPLCTHRKLFLGYKMDTWNYRLAASLLPRQATWAAKQMLAVRVTTSKFEEFCWERIGVSNLAIDTESFAIGAMKLLDAPEDRKT